MSAEFDAGQDFPPVGATVVTRNWTATFREDPFPGWWLTDGRVARPFDSTGLLVAQAWARNPIVTTPEESR